MLPHTPHTLLPHADSACPMLTLCSACRRTMRGRIFESKNMAHIGVGSAIRACDSPAGRGCAREAGARARARSVFQRCSAHVALMVPRGMFSACCARRRSILHAALLGACCLMPMRGVCVKSPVPVRSLSVHVTDMELFSHIHIPIPVLGPARE